MSEAIKHGLGNLLNLQGRDARQAFWYYVLFVYIVTFAISLVVVVPTTIQAVVGGIQQGMEAARFGGAEAAEFASQRVVAGSMARMMSTTMWLGMATSILMLVLLAAAFVRRLHDSGLSGLWALIPGAIQIMNIFLAPMLMRQVLGNLTQIRAGDPMAGMRAMQGSMGAVSLLGWAAIIIVIVLGVRKSTPGPNRFGDKPFVA